MRSEEETDALILAKIKAGEKYPKIAQELGADVSYVNGLAKIAGFTGAYTREKIRSRKQMAARERDAPIRLAARQLRMAERAAALVGRRAERVSERAAARELKAELKREAERKKKTGQKQRPPRLQRLDEDDAPKTYYSAAEKDRIIEEWREKIN